MIIYLSYIGLLFLSLFFKNENKHSYYDISMAMFFLSLLSLSVFITKSEIAGWFIIYINYATMIFSIIIPLVFIWEYLILKKDHSISEAEKKKYETREGKKRYLILQMKVASAATMIISLIYYLR